MLELSGIPPVSSRIFGQLSDHHQEMFDAAEERLSLPYEGIRTSEGLIPGLFPIVETGLSFNSVVHAREAFMAALTDSQRREVAFPLETDKWRRWSNVHRFMMRHGLMLEDLSSAQRDLALEVVEGVLSPSGTEAIRGVMRLNETLQEVSGRFDEHGLAEFGEWMYWFSLMGDFPESQSWGWQLDGHHLNINCLIHGSQIVLTPFFLGSELLVAESGKFAGVRVLEFEESLALRLVQSLHDEQREQAILSPTMPPELFAGAFRDNLTLNYAGIRFGELSSTQQRLLLELIGVYIHRLEDKAANQKMREIETHLGDTYFAWMGETNNESVFYYRVHSPVILLEFDHEPGIVFKSSGPMKNHIHTMIRTPNGNDYGMDYIRQHRESDPSHNSR